MTNEKRIKHPSMGMVRAARISGGHGRLIGSGIKHQHYVKLEVFEAEQMRSYHGNQFYSSNKPLIEVHLSSVQFAELIANMNSSGVPCTLHRVNGELREPPPELETETETIQKEFKDDILKTTKSIREALLKCREIISSKKQPRKGDLKEIDSRLYEALQMLQDNIPFLNECFTENVEKIILDGKAEIESYFLSKVISLGIEALNDKIEKGEMGITSPINMIERKGE